MVVKLDDIKAKFFCRHCRQQNVILEKATLGAPALDGDITVGIFGRCQNCEEEFIDIPCLSALIEYGLAALQTIDQQDETFQEELFDAIARTLAERKEIDY